MVFVLPPCLYFFQCEHCSVFNMKITLPIVIYELIGDMAGDIIYKLVFTMTNKRKELSSKVRIECRHSGKSYPLHKHTWKQGHDIDDIRHYFRCLEDDYYLERPDTFVLKMEHYRRRFNKPYTSYYYEGVWFRNGSWGNVEM